VATLSTRKVDAARRTWSLRREWSRAFAIMLAFLLIAAVASIAGVRGVVDAVGGTAHQLHRESVTVAALRSDLVAHEEVGHQLLSDSPVDRVAYVKQQQHLSDEFAAAVPIFPTTNGLRATVLAARKSWQAGLTKYGLWATELPALHGNHAASNPTYGASSDATGALLDGLEGPSLEAMNAGLTHGSALEETLMIALAALFALALAVTVYFRRRMSRDLIRPVANLRQGVLELRSGDYDHRIDIARYDELGELAEAFNGMAEALHEGHEKLTLRASHDVLTGLPNRASLTERLAIVFNPGPDRRATQESVLFIDIDDFKDVNDSIGHEGGDELLTQLVSRLVECVRPHDMVARLGGDEFAVVVNEDDGVSAAVVIAERILQAVREPFLVRGTRQAVSVSIGVAQRRPETADAAELLRQADFAMYTAKGSGKGRYEIFDTKMHSIMVDRSALKADLAVAATADQLRLEYQPVANLGTGEIVGLEALVRWQHPTLGLLAPAHFITLAEETGDIDAIGHWVLDTAARQAAEWRRTLPFCADVWMSVNLSAYQLLSQSGLAAIRDVLTNPETHADKIVLEITETALAADIDGGIATLNELKQLGVRIALDDFGTGFSSLSTLTRLPVDILKIDRSFISAQTATAASVPMLEGVLGLAAKLSLDVIAEGIEEAAQLDMLHDLGCELGQGYLLARPAPAQTVEARLAGGGHVNAKATRIPVLGVRTR
jgi:diguanylate cyclase (GGDEF)-like protein